MRLTLWIVAGLAMSTAALADAPPDFSGAWVARDGGDTAAADKSAPDPARSGARGMGGGHGVHGGMGGGSGRHGHGAQDSAKARDAAATDALPDPRLHARTLIIRQSEVVFDIAADGARTAYRFDNRNNYGAQYGGTVTLTWAEPEMVIESHPDTGGSIEERYALAADGKQLRLSVRTQRAGEEAAHEFKRVFVLDDGRRDDGSADAAASANQPTLPP